MKVTCNRDQLFHAFQMVAPVVPARAANEILLNVKMEVSDGMAVLSATNYEIGIRVGVSGLEVAEPGQAILPKDRFGQIVKELADESLLLETDDSGLHLKGQHSKFHFPSADPLDFPPVPGFDVEKYHQIEARLFREMIRRTAFSTDTSEAQRFALGGVLLEFSEDHITAVGTDSRRMAIVEGAAKAINEHHVADALTIVPTSAMMVIERALAEAEGDCKVAINDNFVLVHTDQATINARLLEGRFPTWRNVLPDAADAVRLTIPVGPLHTSVRQAAVVADKESDGVDLQFSTGDLTLHAESSGHGDGTVQMPVSYEGPELTIRLNHKYLTEFFRVLASDATVQLSLVDGESAALFSTEDGYRYIVMPLSHD